MAKNALNAAMKEYFAFFQQHIKEGQHFIQPFANESVPYRSVNIPAGSMVFCTPPKQTTGKKLDTFDHRQFWIWCNILSLNGNVVFVLENTAPPDWVPVMTRSARKNTEHLFLRAQAYDEDAARAYYSPPLHKTLTLKQSLNFIASATKAENSHVMISNYRVTATTPVTTISAPIDIPHNVKPHSKTLAASIKLIDTIASPVATSITPEGNLLVVADNFKTTINCLTEDELIQPIPPAGFYVETAAAVYEAILNVAPFMSPMTHRPWVNSVMVGAKSCLATDNIVFCESFHHANLPMEFMLPAEAVYELVAINEAPSRLQVCENSVTFWYSNERYFTTSLIDPTAPQSTWPIERIREKMHVHAEFNPVAEELFDNLKKIKQFVDSTGHVFLSPTGIRTKPEYDIGTVMTFATGVSSELCFKHAALMLIEDVAASIAWRNEPVLFHGKQVCGMVLGIRY